MPSMSQQFSPSRHSRTVCGSLRLPKRQKDATIENLPTCDNEHLSRRYIANSLEPNWAKGAVL